MVDVFDEVEEELRQERYHALLRKWGPWVPGGAVTIVAGVAGYQILYFFFVFASDSTSGVSIQRSDSDNFPKTVLLLSKGMPLYN